MGMHAGTGTVTVRVRVAVALEDGVGRSGEGDPWWLCSQMKVTVAGAARCWQEDVDRLSLLWGLDRQVRP